MNPFSLLLAIFSWMYLHMFLVIILNSLSFRPNQTAFASGNHSDHSALLKFKESIYQDPYGVLHSWNSSTHFCNWHGVTCNNLMHQRVTQLNLGGYKLQGSISPHVGNLSFLSTLNLMNNAFYGRIPQELGRLLQLQQLYLKNNSLDGEVPTNLTNCSELNDLDLYGNNLIGKIPIEIGSLKKLQLLIFQSNKLTGQIPASLGNLSSLTILGVGQNNLEGDIPQELGHLLHLQVLDLANNLFHGEFPTNLTKCAELKKLSLYGNNLFGTIPVEIGHLGKLEWLNMARNKFTGQIPASIGNLSSLALLGMHENKLEGNIPQEIRHLRNLTMISLHVNKLHGMLPSNLFNMSSLTVISFVSNQFNGSLPSNMFHTLPNLEKFYIGMNQMSGPIPSSITNASVLRELDISENYFVGQVPSLGKLQYVERINLEKNNLGANSSKDLDFFKTLTNCSVLRILSISYNNFGGFLPNYIGNFSTKMSALHLGYNQMSGKLPPELGNLDGLILLSIQNSHFDGIIPTTFGKFQKIQVLDLRGNKLSGDIPAYIGNFSKLFHLDLSQNMFQGNIPPSIGNCQKLQYLSFSQNNLSGLIPPEVFTIFSLVLDLSHNLLSGSLPNKVGKLKNIYYLDVSNNHLSGDIPEIIGECTSLEYLYLQVNFIDGTIPSSLASLKDLREFDLSQNLLTGSIPESMQNISMLTYLNVSFNMLDGKVPTKGVFQNVSAFTMSNNRKLCGGIPELHLPPCPAKGRKLVKHNKFTWLVATVVSIVAFLMILSCSLTIYWMRKRNNKPSPDSPRIDQLTKISYQNLYRGTDGFSTINLIGCGSFGSVYKGTLESEDKVVAVKVLNLQNERAHKSFIAECNALRNIRHRNLVKILTCCSSIDYKGQEFKALVFEFMTNGSLESWLHPVINVGDHPKSLDFWQRLSIIIDVASALHYLHYECEQAIIHCDLKPSNILLDDCFVAHVSDFGLARMLSSIGVFPKQSSTIGIEGTIGYTPPEYGMSSNVSIEGDMYNFGILILEILTGKRPTSEMFRNDQNLHNYVEVSIPNHLFHIVDPTILPGGSEWTDDDDETLIFMHPNIKKCLLSLFQVALACSVEAPKERITMVDVTRELNFIKSYLPSKDINGVYMLG